MSIEAQLRSIDLFSGLVGAVKRIYELDPALVK